MSTSTAVTLVSHSPSGTPSDLAGTTASMSFPATLTADSTGTDSTRPGATAAKSSETGSTMLFAGSNAPATGNAMGCNTRADDTPVGATCPSITDTAASVTSTSALVTLITTLNGPRGERRVIRMTFAL